MVTSVMHVRAYYCIVNTTPQNEVRRLAGRYRMREQGSLVMVVVKQHELYTIRNNQGQQGHARGNQFDALNVPPEIIRWWEQVSHILPWGGRTHLMWLATLNGVG